MSKDEQRRKNPKKPKQTNFKHHFHYSRSKNSFIIITNWKNKKKCLKALYLYETITKEYFFVFPQQPVIKMSKVVSFPNHVCCLRIYSTIISVSPESMYNLLPRSTKKITPKETLVQTNGRRPAKVVRRDGQKPPFLSLCFCFSGIIPKFYLWKMVCFS